LVKFWQFGIFSPVLVYFVKKYLATLRRGHWLNTDCVKVTPRFLSSVATATFLGLGKKVIRFILESNFCRDSGLEFFSHSKTGAPLYVAVEKIIENPKISGSLPIPGKLLQNSNFK
jgi:hypothetical protein